MEDKRQYYLQKWMDLITPGSDGTQAIYNAMAENSKEISIAFAKFAMDNTFQDMNTNEYWAWDDNGNVIEYTDDELYNLFINSQEK
jgi:hypothetical protein